MEEAENIYSRRSSKNKSEYTFLRFYNNDNQKMDVIMDRCSRKRYIKCNEMDERWLINSNGICI